MGQKRFALGGPAMKKLALLFYTLALVVGGLHAEEYPLGPDSQRQPGVPQGTVAHYTWKSRIFPGTVRDYWVYVPAQYASSKPVCVMVFQDGETFMKEDGRARIPIVFDNLIAKHEMPVTIGIFINPGVLKAPSSADQQDRFNRSFEYDSLGDRYARFLLDEILPDAAGHYNLSTRPDDRAIAGLSSGGICAFNVAWNRPDAFHRVLSFIGSFTDLRGGDIYPALIRKTEPKPLRVFLQDGNHDLNIFAGDWWLSNQAMASALEYAGYDVKFVTGDKDHDMIQGGAILPDALRWLWRDYPQPIAKPKGAKDSRFGQPILDPGHEWELAADHVRANSGLAVDAKGNVYFTSGENDRIDMIGDSRTGLAPGNGSYAVGMIFGPDSRLYTCQADGGAIVAYSAKGPAPERVTEGVGCYDLTVTHTGKIYFTDPKGHRIWLVNAKGERRTVYYGHIDLGGVALSPDQSQLYVSDPTTKWVTSFRIEIDSSLTDEEPFYRLETPDGSSVTGAVGMTLDSLGYLYIATNLGVQVCDQPGRVVAIINPPGSEPVSAVVFGGEDLQDLYIVADNKIYKRHLLRKGVLPWVTQKPPAPHL